MDYAALFTGEFLGLAQIFRNIALNAKLMKKKTDLWMPKKWRELANIPHIIDPILTVKSFNRLKQPFSLYVLPVAAASLELSHKSRCT